VLFVIFHLYFSQLTGSKTLRLSMGGAVGTAGTATAAPFLTTFSVPRYGPGLSLRLELHEF